MISSIISRVVIIVFGTLYPAYASYKAVKTKNVKEYVKWMMYWIVFALFTCAETFTDIFLSWFPFYYEIKVILVIWLLSPATKGSSILYRKFVHPMLSSREQEIDEYISKAKEQSYKQVLGLGQKGVTVLMQTAIKSGGGIVSQLKKSYSLSDLSDPSNSASDEVDDVLVTDPRLIRRRKSGRSPHRSSSASSASVYFSEVDVVAKKVASGEGVAELRSIEDISSGYSSGEGLYVAHQPLKLQSRDSIANQRTNSLTRSRSTRVTRSSVPKKSSITSDDSDENEVFDTNIVFFNDRARKILSETNDSSSSETEFHDIPETIGFELHGPLKCHFASH
ncbi:receptor expression-enhancing protein 4-like isoform X5 [Euwallacea similis]|uniref:receptor expression-enhancing protein 4-like isoform X5 n=1 Tax=Euwallacea similis TaxID=1736056 RepID=UPI00344E80F9